MRVFVSSVIRGFAEYRAAAAAAVTSLGHTPVRAEDLGATADTPQRACLGEVRSSDLVLLLLGERYGPVQAGDLSATHEEYREARGRVPVLLFVQDGVGREARQDDFLKEVQGWEAGHMYERFTDPESLRGAITRAVHRHELRSYAGPVSEEEMIGRASQALPPRDANTPELALAISGGPRQTVLRPAELDDPDLHRELLAECLTGTLAVLDPARGAAVAVEGGALVVKTQSGPGRVSVNDEGTIAITRSALAARTRGEYLPVLIDEDLRAALARGLRLGGRIMDRVDGVGRLSHVAVAACLLGASGHAWRTRAEHARSPNSMEVSLCSDRIVAATKPAVHLRRALVMDADRLAGDLATLLRREMRRYG